MRQTASVRDSRIRRLLVALTLVTVSVFVIPTSAGAATLRTWPNKVAHVDVLRPPGVVAKGGQAQPLMHNPRRPLGDASYFGSMANADLNGEIVSMAAEPSGSGYWLLGSDGGVFSFGHAPFYGSTGSLRLNKPVRSMAANPNGGGYWFVATDGGVFAYGNVGFFGSMGGSRLNQPIVGMAATPSGNGYWMVASDGGIFAFGDAAFHGSTGSLRLNQPIVGMAPTPSGHGYWLVASDGGIFAFGDAGFFGSAGATPLNQPIVGMSATTSGKGYWLAAADGGMFAYGNAQSFGTGGAHGRIIAMARTKSGNGYWFASANGAVIAEDYPTVRTPLAGESPASSTSYAFLEIKNGQPGRWDPCRGAIPYYISTANLPSYGPDIVHASMNNLASITGLRFRFAGATSQLITGELYIPDAIVIGWVKPGQSPVFSGDQVGLSNVARETSGKHQRISGSTISLLDQTESFNVSDEAWRIYFRMVLDHELGHTVGLDHVNDPDQLMYPTDGNAWQFWNGDLQGLMYIGAYAGCIR